MQTLFTLLLALVLALPAAAQALVVSTPVATTLQQISAAGFKAHVQYLADDRLRGRLPGTPGYQLAVDYVTAQFQQMGVRPAGENGGFAQKVRLRRAFVEPGATLAYQAPGSSGLQQLALGKDFGIHPNPHVPQVAVAAEVVFAGYGISAPELGYDDYAGLPATGKIVVVTRQPLRQFGDNERQYFGDVRTVLETASRHGAVGVLLASSQAGERPAEFPKGLVSALRGC